MYLRVSEISRSFGKDSFSLDNISFSVPSGEIFALLGESGSGKTTLLRIIAGFETPDLGKVELDNRILVDNSRHLPPEKRQTGLVFQDHALFPHLTVEKNICYGIKKETNVRQKLQEMLQLTSLDGLEKRYPHELSGGQQQRVAIARSLAAEPKLLLLDEPFSNLDDSIKTQVRTEIRSILKKCGTASIFVTHDTQDCLAVADQVLILQNGKALQTGTPESIYRQPASAYIARLFGPVNEFSLEELKIAGLDANQNLVRPHAIKITSSDGILARVVDCYFNGSGFTVIAESKVQKIIVFNEEPVTAGQEIKISKK